MVDSNQDSGAERREHERYDVAIEVDYRSEENFLFAYIENISEMGIFIRAEEPMPIGTEIALRFAHEGKDFSLNGEVAWVNTRREGDAESSPGMGVRFVDLNDEQRDEVVSLVRTIAYLQQD